MLLLAGLWILILVKDEWTLSNQGPPYWWPQVKHLQAVQPTPVETKRPLTATGNEPGTTGWKELIEPLRPPQKPKELRFLLEFSFVERRQEAASDRFRLDSNELGGGRQETIFCAIKFFCDR